MDYNLKAQMPLLLVVMAAIWGPILLMTLWATYKVIREEIAKRG